MLKKAMIMAAGVGSRLEPLTSVIPKPLVPLANISAMDLLIGHLENFGITNIIANTFYKAEDIKNHYKYTDFVFVKEEELSGTAGGVKKCQFFFDEGEDFIILSGDGLTDLDIKSAYESHKNSHSIATIVTKKVDFKDVSKYGIIVTNEDNSVKSFQEKPSLEEAKSNLANTGIYIFNYKIFDYIPANTFYDFAKDVFPSILSNGIKINTYKHNGYWSDIGSIEQYKQSNIDLLDKKVNHYYPEGIYTFNGTYIKGKNSYIDENVKIIGNCIIGNNCKIHSGVTLKNSIIWNNATIKGDIIIENSIVMSDSLVTENIIDTIYEPNKDNLMV